MAFFEFFLVPFLWGGGKVTWLILRDANFFSPKTHHIIYQSNRLESANKILFSDRYVIFSRLEDIKQNVWSRDHFWRHRYFFSEKIWQFQSLIKIHWLVVLKKLNTLYDTTFQGLSNECIEKWISYVPRAWRHLNKFWKSVVIWK